jgi:hypothetical protein
MVCGATVAPSVAGLVAPGRPAAMIALRQDIVVCRRERWDVLAAASVSLASEQATPAGLHEAMLAKA